MAIKRMDNVAIVVSDLKAAIAFFRELGMELVGETTVKGDWVDRVIGLKGVESDIALMRTPDGYGKIELSRFKAPVAVGSENGPMNILGKHRVMFTVDDIEDTVARLRAHGAELVGEIVRYEDVYLLCYLRGPEGIMLGLAEEIAVDNKHLESVFNIILPALEKAEVDYLVFGGISVAAYAGRFVRENGDVDVFVRDGDFEKARRSLERLCKQNNFCKKLRKDRITGRLKLEIFLKERIGHIFSMIPVYEENNSIVFKYPEEEYGGNQSYPRGIMEKTERYISGFRFFAPRDEFIKKIFMKNYDAVRARGGKVNKKDVEVIKSVCKL